VTRSASSNSVDNVLVVGGGIAGLTAANALARKGATCEVVELGDGPAGTAITLLHRALDGLEEIGVLDRILEEGVPRSPQELFRYHGPAGAVLPSVLAATSARRLPAGIVVYRPTMAAILREAAEESGATVRLGVGLVDLAPGTDTVTATFTDGSRRSFDLVVGADGVRSRTRAVVFPDAPEPRYSGQTMFRWVVGDMPDIGRVGFYQSEYLLVTLRMEDGRVYVATGREFREKRRLDEVEAHRVVGEILQTFTAPFVVDLRERLTDDIDILVDDYDWLLLPEPWHRGRVVLIGDAAHATTAHLASGAGMAIEDAVVLGQEVGAGGPVQEILQRFMARRFERVRLLVDTSVELRRMTQRGDPIPEQNAVRGTAMAVLASPY
jgi:2-polyprenyl-6-methoxyphenol hydroxylase-like FAD-dependent oxidoreductase